MPYLEILHNDPSLVEGYKIYIELLFQVQQKTDQHAIIAYNPSLAYYIINKYQYGVSGKIIMRYFKILSPASSLDPYRSLYPLSLYPYRGQSLIANAVIEWASQNQIGVEDYLSLYNLAKFTPLCRRLF